MTSQSRTVQRTFVRIVLALGLALPSSALASEPTPEASPAPPPEAGTPEALGYWKQQLEQASFQLTERQDTLEAARAAYQDWRQRKYPRGKRKSEVVGAVDRAVVALEEAVDSFPGVLESARKAGVSNAVLRRFENSGSLALPADHVDSL